MLDKLFQPRTLAGIVVAVMIAAGTAVAATSTGPRPTLPASEESTTSSTEAVTTSTSVVETTTSTTEAPATTSTTEAPAKPGPAGTEGHPQNHGACVSAAAHDTPPGPGHGAAVSKVAHSDCGKTAKATGGSDNSGD